MMLVRSVFVGFMVTLTQEICQLGAVPFSPDAFDASWLDHLADARSSAA
jgi:hypothetical protein